MSSHHLETADRRRTDRSAVPASPDQAVHLRGTGKFSGRRCSSTQQSDDSLVESLIPSRRNKEYRI